jgi:hypothetical protein
MWWHTKSPLIESHEGQHISFYKYGERRVIMPMASHELHRCHEPMSHMFFQMAQCNTRRSSILLHHGWRGKGRQHLRDPSTSPISFSLTLSSFHPTFFFRHREGGKERTADCAKGCRGAQGRPPSLTPEASVVKWLGPIRRHKGLGKLCLHTSPTPSTSCQIIKQGIWKSNP